MIPPARTLPSGYLARFIYTRFGLLGDTKTVIWRPVGYSSSR